MSPPKYVDLIVLALALPVFLLGGFPMLGYAAAAASWLVQRGIQGLANRKADEFLARGSRRNAMSTVAVTSMGRVWLMAAVVLLVGLLGEREAGLAAALLVTVLFTVSFAAQGVAHLFEPEGQEAVR